MQFEHAFDLAGDPAAVIAVFEDLPLLASFLPGASVGEPREDGSWPGQLMVAFGPKRLTFKGSLTHAVQREQLAGELTGHASADVRGAKMSVSMQYRLSPAAAGTRVDLVSQAELTGLLAEFARTGGVVVMQALLEEFASNFSAHMAARCVPQPSLVMEAAAPPPPWSGSQATPAPQALSVFGLLWRMLRNLFTRSASPAPRDTPP